VGNVLLFDPFKLRSVQLKNRIIISPMCQYMAHDGQINDWHLVHLGKFAQGGAALVFVEATAVEERGRNTHGDVGIWDDRHIPGLKRIADLIRGQGAVPGIQLAHAGRKASIARPWYGNGPLTASDFARGDNAWAIVGPSDRPAGEGWLFPHALTLSELDEVRSSYRAAVLRALHADFDVVEIHGAHGYLLHSFLSPLANFRTDDYGGNIEQRMKFPLEIAELVRESWPKDKPVFFRCSAVDDYDGGWKIEDSVRLSRELKTRGIDVIDCSSGGIVDSATSAVRSQPQTPRTPGFQLPYAERIRHDVDIPTMAVGLILSAHQAEDALQQGRADLIAIGREALFNPNWPLHAAYDLGVAQDYSLWPVQYGFWLTRRESSLRAQGITRQPPVELATNARAVSR
jgi:2,4-dienoyl-CoA reductase-like NADH-dependent reductase (Old Yellow Enzyme family)